MVVELPDWVRGTVLLARTATGDVIPILVDDAGQLNILMRGSDAGGTVRTVRVDNEGQLYAIMRGASGVDVAVDALGFLTAVLKGEYAGALHTLAVDAQGRLQAFVLDGEDQWGQVLRIGNSELSARLKGRRVFDWRGHTAFITDFEHGNPSGIVTLAGTGASGELSPDYWQTGGYSFKLVGGSDGDHYAAWQVVLAIPPSTRLGTEGHFSIDVDAESVGLSLAGWSGGWLCQTGIRANLLTDKLQYWNTLGAWADFADIWLVKQPYIFYALKLVVDLSTGYYVRCLFNDTQHDMSALQFKRTPSIKIPYILVFHGLISRVGYNDVGYLDRAIVTVNEP